MRLRSVVQRIQERDAERQKAAADHDQFITDMAK
ncbi:hypothetical protein ABID41_001102 [Phenylobacterium koreense]|uniref:Uncharacterized protein n=1 Tax=Phenylobacterium koreense TaxID=266125 RepID=A0ABV2EGV1_9CAUL